MWTAMGLVGSAPMAQAQDTGETLKDKAERLRLRLGIPDGTPLIKIMELASARLGIENETAAAPSLVVQLDICLQRADMLAAQPLMGQSVILMAQPVIPIGQVVAEFGESDKVLQAEARAHEAEQRARDAEVAMRFMEVEMRARSAEQTLAEEQARREAEERARREAEERARREAEERATAPQPQSMGRGIPEHGGLDGVWRYETSSGQWTGTMYWGTAITIRGMQAYMQGSILVNPGTVVYHFTSVDPRHITGTEQHVNLFCGCCPVGIYGPVPIVGRIDPDGRLTLTIDYSTGTYTPERF